MFSAPLVMLALGLGPSADVPEPAPPAADGRRVGVAGVSLAGDVPAGWNEPLARIVDRALGKVGATPVDLVPPAVCDAACLRELAKDSADFVLVGRLTGEERVYAISLELLEVASGESFRSEQSCAPCGQSEVEELVERQATALVDRALEAGSVRARIEISSRPAGAEVTLDGVVVGTTPMAVPMLPGRHELRISHDGYDPLSRELTAVRGVVERWDADLRPIAPPPKVAPTDSPPSRARAGRGLWIGGWTSLGVGVAALAAGSTFLALHHRPYRARCDGGDFDAADGLCRYRYDGVPWGASLVAVGAAGVVSGAVMLGIAAKRRKAPATVSFVPARGGGFFGVAWRG